MIPPHTLNDMLKLAGACASDAVAVLAIYNACAGESRIDLDAGPTRKPRKGCSVVALVICHVHRIVEERLLVKNHMVDDVVSCPRR